MRMERGSIPLVNAQGRARGMSYGQYVGAVYYPVVIVEVLPDGGEIQRTAAVPEAARPVATVAAAQEVRKKPVSKKEGRKCVICGGELGPYQRKYCSDDCSRQAAKERYDSAERKPYVSAAKREDRPCAVCGKLMVQVTGQKKYCSAKCSRLGGGRPCRRTTESGTRRSRSGTARSAVSGSGGPGGSTATTAPGPGARTTSGHTSGSTGGEKPRRRRLPRLRIRRMKHEWQQSGTDVWSQGELGQGQ